MGEIVEFPSRREPCSRWRRGQASISLTARPACAALAMALATATPPLKAHMSEPVARESVPLPIRSLPSR
ncbi:MAG TPA: hypothetical protein VF503_26330 [Sphingobium sp.]|uniref:hypothetical protein n=1 Tax=Sphingobium sp. TaxID=1912891 RepID=UPI002ED43039